MVPSMAKHRQAGTASVLPFSVDGGGYLIADALPRTNRQTERMLA